MRNKLKKIWNKEDGFTLVELLGVIVILGIILAIAIPGIGKVVDNARTKTAEQQELLVLDAAKIYELDGNTIGDGVTDGTLFRKGYLDQNPKGTITVVKDPTTGALSIDPKSKP